jgi:biopolymer transport protein ExbB
MPKTCRRRVVDVDVVVAAVRVRGRPVRAGLAVLVVMCGVLLSDPGSRAIAQDRGSPPASVSKPGGGGVSVGTTSGNDEADAAAGTDDGKSGTPRVDAQESFLAWMARASGWIGLVIALMSFYLIALIVWMAQRYRTTVAVPRELVIEVQNLLEQVKYNDAYHKLVSDSSFLARVLAAGVRKLPAGLSHAQRAMELANEDVTMEMEHRTTYLATVGTLGPMIGLVGTVYGMILSFRVIAVAGSSPQASQLAAGISTALFATLEGIGVSIPAIFFYALFRNRIARLSLEVGMTAEPLLEKFAPGVRVVSSAQGAGTGPAASAGPPPSPPAHAHPFAVSAALAATQRPALPG